jgi:hypothetical protein
MTNITEKIHKALGIEAAEYWTTHKGRKLPAANNTNNTVGTTLEQGGAIQIKMRGKGGTEENEKTLLSSMLGAAAGKRRKERGLIQEQVRANGQTVPCTVTWDKGDREETRKIRELIQDYLKLTGVKCEPGTTEAERKTAENQLVLAENGGAFTIRPKLSTRGKRKVITHHHTGTLMGQNISHWENHVYKAYMERAWNLRENPEERHKIKEEECYQQAREKVREHEQNNKEAEQTRKSKHEDQYGQETRKQQEQEPQGMTTRLKRKTQDKRREERGGQGSSQGEQQQEERGTQPRRRAEEAREQTHEDQHERRGEQEEQREEAGRQQEEREQKTAERRKTKEKKAEEEKKEEQRKRTEETNRRADRREEQKEN